MKRSILQLAVICFLAFTLNSSATVLYVDLNSTNPVSPYADWSTAATNIQDAIDAAIPGDQILVTNGVYQTGGRVVYGSLTNRVVINKAVTVQSVNGPAATVIQGTKPIGASAVRCVYLASDSIFIGFTLANGSTSNDGDVDLEQSGGGIWCDFTSVVISNCVFADNSANGSGGGVIRGSLNSCLLTNNSAGGGGGAIYESTLNHCRVLNNSATYGGGANSCFLTNCALSGNSAYWAGGAIDSTLQTCALSNNTADQIGGGAAFSTLNQCILSGNSSSAGGGAIYSTLNNCTLSDNSAFFVNGEAGLGGGAAYCSMANCVVTGNSAVSLGGGTEGGALNNCIVYFNIAPDGSNYDGYYSECNLNYCCTTPLPDSGQGNITNEPIFVNLAGVDFHLQSNSPCINSGNNHYVTSTTDLDGSSRIVGGTVDIGAYEFQNPASALSYAWAQQYGLPTDGSADYLDSDGDGMNNWQEFLADTSPLDANDFLHVTSFTRSGTYNTLWWTSKSTRLYQVQRRETLGDISPWETIITNATPGWNNVGFDNTGPQNFYRILAVQP